MKSATSPYLAQSQPLEPQGRRRATEVMLESLGVFLVGFAAMSFIYTDPPGSFPEPIGVPGNDSFYHIKMASMIPEYGLVDTFPWLKFCFFTREGDSFVSHHYGFHTLLLPFIKAYQWFGNGDLLAAGRTAISTFFAVSLVLMNGLLIYKGVRWRWLWLMFFFLLPSQFIGRHAFVRAISPSLMLMLVIVATMFQRRYLMTAIAIALYNHLYLGAVMFSPVIVGLYVFSCIIGPKDDREIPWKLVLFSVGGWIAGVLTYPYRAGMLEFLQLQVFGSGLSPDIPVGREWTPYSDTWWFAQMAGPLLIIWAASFCMRTRLGKPLNAQELSLLLITLVFLVLTLKAKRFIEYWPAFCLLSSAYMAAPVLNRFADWLDPWMPNRETTARQGRIALISLVSIIGIVIAFVWVKKSAPLSEGFASSWLVWASVAAVFVLAVVMGPGDRSTGGERHRHYRIWFIGLGVAGVLLTFTLVGAMMAMGLPKDVGLFDVRLPIPWLIVLALILGLGALSVYKAKPDGEARPAAEAIGRSGTMLLAGLAVVSITVAVAARPLSDRQRDVNCSYDLPAIAAAMDFLKAHSDPGDVIFTDDWDIFPVFFYHNSYNHYIVGLDPKFTQHREPELWERYVKISRGQVPSTMEVNVPGVDGALQRRKIKVILDDIRERFGARFVVTDRDHKPLARKLADAPSIARLIYPMTDYEVCRDDPYLIFEIVEGEAPMSEPVSVTADSDADLLYLSSMTPTFVDQGYGELRRDRSVEGGPIRIGETIYKRGLGSHTPLRLEYEIPERFDSFEAIVGINRDTDGRGSATVRVLLDGEEVFESPRMTGRSDPVSINIPLGDSRRLTLLADPDDEGNRFDHVDWADARFVRRAEG